MRISPTKPQIGLLCSAIELRTTVAELSGDLVAVLDITAQRSLGVMLLDVSIYGVHGCLKIACVNPGHK